MPSTFDTTASILSAVSSFRENPTDTCPGCGSEVDCRGVFPLAQLTCPACGNSFPALRHLDHFELRSVLGQGGMGVVYKALDEELRRLVALKLVNEKHGLDLEMLRQLREEALTMAAIQHPNVVQVYSSGADRGYLYITMELVERGSLATLMDEHGRIPERDCLRMAVEVARGLAAVYQKGMLHRDIKPGNILFDGGLHAKIVDFGLAINADRASQEGGTEIWGTPYYLPPEKLEGKPEDFRSDIYAFGATFFHALTGRPLFEAPTSDGVVMKHLKSPPPSVQTYAPDVSGPTAFVIASCVQKDPEKRYQNYEELIAHLEYAQAELESRGAGGGNDDAGNGKRRLVLESEETQKAGAWLTIAMLVLAVGAVVGLLISWKGSGKPSEPQIVQVPEERAEPVVEETVKPAAIGGITVLRSHNFPDRTLRHQYGRMRTDAVVNPAQDAEFIIVPGLSDPDGISFEATNFPGRYIHVRANGEVFSDPTDSTTEFKENATFRRMKGFADPAKYSYQMWTDATRYLRHRGDVLYAEVIKGDLAEADATFAEEPVKR